MEGISTATASATEILEALEGETSGSLDALDAAGARRLFAQLEKRYDKNAELRIKYVGEPEKFLESESELNDAIQVRIYSWVTGRVSVKC